eukprot:4028378-Prymnesium_polylepis.1
MHAPGKYPRNVPISCCIPDRDVLHAHGHTTFSWVTQFRSSALDFSVWQDGRTRRPCARGALPPRA